MNADKKLKQSLQEKAEEYKKQQKLTIDKYKVGEKDTNGNLITKIFGRGDEFVVYEIETKDLVDSLKVWIETRIEDDRVPIDNFNKIRAKFSEIKGLLYKVVDKTTTKAIISQIVINAIRGNVEEANRQFGDLVKQINLEYREQFNNRMRMLLSASIITVIIILFSTREYYEKSYVGHIHIHNLIYILAGGSMGALFSLTIGLNKIVCEKDVEWWLYMLYGLERISIGLLASVIVYFAIKADLAFSICGKMNNPVIGYVFFAILSGFSETLVPNLLINIEKEKAK